MVLVVAGVLSAVVSLSSSFDGGSGQAAAGQPVALPIVVEYIYKGGGTSSACHCRLRGGCWWPSLRRRGH